MKGTLILLFALSTFSAMFGQKTSDTIYYNRNWDVTTRNLAGYYRLQTKVKTEDTTYWEFGDYYMDNDQLQNEGFLGELKPEQRIGYWKWYYQSGLPKMEGTYDDNVSVGEWKYYHTNGALKKKGILTDKGKRDGEWIWYHDDSTLMSKARFRNDTILGDRTWFYENGQAKKHEYYNEKGRVDSLKEEWYSNKNLKSKVSYTDGFKNGEERNYYLDGSLKSIIQYKTGISHDEDEVYFNLAGKEVPKDSVINEKEFHNLLWKIEGNGIKKPSYLFGTMHVKDKQAFEFSDSMLLAFNNAEGYTMEIHPDSLYAYYFSQYDKYKSPLFFGSEVIGGYSPESYFESWASRGNYSKWVMNLNEIFHRDTYNPEGMPYFVDCYLYYIAKKQGKFTDGIERVLDHVNAGKDLPRNDLDYDILTKIDPAQEMLDTYQEGHLKKINALMELLQNEEFRYRLLTIRNIKMAEAIDSLAHVRSTFNTAGTAHLPGDDGVIALLREKGYTLTAVKAVFSGDSLDYTVNNLKNDWQRVKPFNTDFTVESPGKITSFNSGVIRNVYLDPIREMGVDAYQLDYRFYSKVNQKKKIVDEDINYAIGNSEILKKEKIKYNGYKGLEIICAESPYSSGYARKATAGEDKVYNRVRMFKKNYQVYVINVGSTSKDSLHNDFANRYLNSLKLPELKIEEEAVAWDEFSDEQGAFSIVSPSNRIHRKLNLSKKSYYSTDEKPEHKVNYWASEDGGDKFIFRYSNSPLGEMFFNDSLVLGKEVVYYENLIGALKDSNYTTFNGYPCVEATYKPNKKHTVRIKLINRGYRHYLLVSQAKSSAESQAKVDKFFNSLKFSDLETQPLKEYVTEEDSIKFHLPESVEQKNTNFNRWFVPSRSLEEKYSSRRYSSYDWWENDYYSSKDDDDYIEPAKAFRNRERFYAADTVSGISYQTYSESFSEFFYLPNRDSLFSYYNDIFHNKTDTVFVEEKDSLIGDESTYWVHHTYKRQVQNGEFQMRFTNKGPHMIIQRVSYPLELKGDSRIQEYFNEVDFTTLKDTFDLFEDKSKQILEGLISKDSTTQVQSRQALSFYPFDSTHVPLIQEYASKEMALDTNDIENNAFQLLKLLSYFDDSTSVEFLAGFYDKYTKDSLELKFKMLDKLEDYKDSIAVAKFKEFVSEDSLQYSYSTSDEYEGVLDYFEDSLQLYANNYGVFNNWMQDTVWNLETKIHKVTLKALEVDSLDLSGINNEYEFLREHYLWVANVYDSLDKDTSIYRRVKTNLTSYTEVMGQFDEQDDSLKAVYLKLLDDKDDDLRFAASKALFRKGETLDSKELDDMLENLENRYKLMLVLNEIDRLDLIPSKYLEEEALAEAQAYSSFSSKYSYYRSSAPVKMKLVKTVTEKIDGEKYKFFVYTYYRDSYRRTKNIGVSNPMKVGVNKTQLFESTSYEETEYTKKEEKALIKQVTQDWLFKNMEIGEAAEGASEEASEATFKF